jgi:hypothetical protein
MGIFFVTHQPVVPEVQGTIRSALLADPSKLGDVDREASHRTLGLIQATAPQFSPSRFIGAVVISVALLLGAIWAAKHNLPDISKDLMTSFSGFSGIVLGLLGGEAQKFSSA